MTIPGARVWWLYSLECMQLTTQYDMYKFTLDTWVMRISVRKSDQGETRRHENIINTRNSTAVELLSILALKCSSGVFSGIARLH